MKDGKTLLIGCKSGLSPYLSETQAIKLLNLAEKIHAILILAVRKKFRGIRWFNVTEQGISEINLQFFRNNHIKNKYIVTS
jgi:hypothetical protein